MKQLSLTVFICSLTLPFFTQASEHFSISGFGNLSTIRSGTEQLGFKYNLAKEGIYDEWRLDTGSNFGLQLNTQFNDSFDMVLQGVVQERLDNDFNKSINLAFLRYQHRDSFSTRFGRFAPPNYQLSEYKDVNFAYLWTKPITDFYALAPETFINGADLSYRFNWLSGQFDFMVWGGQTYVTSINSGENYEITLYPLLGAKLIYQNQDLHASVAVATTKVKKGNPADSFTAIVDNPLFSSAWPASQNFKKDFQFPGTRVGYYSFSIAYDGSPWQIQSELSYTDLAWPFFPDLVAGYFSLARNFGQLTPYGFYSRAKSIGDIYEITPPPISTTNAMVLGVYMGIDANLKSQVVNNETFGFGVRYDLSPTIAIKGQIERTHLISGKIGAWLPRNNATLEAAPNHIDTLSFNVSFVF